ncbi:hypothetical protein EGI22_17460 [Lacihabitans sp. LS3-19]|uniref:DUF5640 domain-containing protein n=1 Tax=Lacihabitans sp. LS3-19 TaxID=2487335 RepID=UPI0020CD8BB7|nr:DUF5640 domain-containing protein [Lacihabitans sp. LS3-19]MCP9769694.1 hypothetical protein [Lacihabitans sp. LS3-19]
MKKIAWLQLISFTLILASCSLFGDIINPEKSVATADIDQKGGSIEATDILVRIPATAFDSQNSLEISEVKNAPTELVSVNSKLFVLEGLPLNVNKGIKIKIKKNTNQPSQIPLLAVGEEIFIKSLNKTAIHYQYLPAVDSSGYTLATLPATDQKISETDASGRVAETKVKMYLISFDGNFSIDTPEGHFKMYFPYLSMKDNVVKLGSNLEGAYSKFKNLGFSYSSRSSWPMNVTIKKLDAGVYGYASNSVLGYNYGCMEFNSDNLKDDDELKLTAGHEFFHLVQSFYDPRNRFSRAKSGNYTHFWLDEATAVWIEKMFSTQTNYVSNIRNSHQMAPFSGFQKGAEENAGEHGYGMSAVVKYLTVKNGDALVRTAYQSIKANKHPVEAISPTTPFIWWDSFFRDYLEGKVYDDVNTGFWLASNHGLFDIKAEKDTVKEFKKTYADYSAAIFRVSLNYDKFTDGANIVFTLPTDADSRVTIYKTVGTKMQLVASAIDKVTLKDILKLKTDKSVLFALVTNTASKAGYLGSRDLTLKIKVNNLELDENLFGKWTTSDGDYSYTFKSDGTAIQRVNGIDYNWNWVIENKQIKMFIPNGKPAYMTYKIENNKLYFWGESLGIWSAPLYKS